MATTPNLTPEQLAALKAELGIVDEETPQAPSQPAPEPIKIRVGNYEFEGNSVEEVQRQIAVYEENLRRQAAASQTTQHVQEQRQEAKPPEPEDDPEWVNEFVKKPKSVLKREIKKAYEEMQRELYGNAENWRQLHQGTVATALEYRVDKFQRAFFDRNQDYNPTPENAAAMERVFQQSGVQPTNLQTLEWGWQEAKRQGLAKPKDTTPSAPPRAPLPMVPTGGSAPSESFEDLFMRTTDPAKQAEMLRKWEAMQQQ